MDKIAFSIFGVDIAWYAIIISFGMILGVLVAMKRAKNEGLDPDIGIEIGIIGIPIGIIGARVYYFIFNYNSDIHVWTDVFSIRSGGLAIHGGIFGGIIAGIIYAKYKNIKFWTLADIVAPSLILGQAIGRWGNYINQEAYGTETTLPWAIEVNGQMVHPTFLYESIWNFMVFGFLIYYTNKKKFTGQIFLLYLMLYSLVRFFIEGLRIDSLMIGDFRVAQIVSFLLIVISLILSRYLLKKEESYGSIRRF